MLHFEFGYLTVQVHFNFITIWFW